MVGNLQYSFNGTPVVAKQHYSFNGTPGVAKLQDSFHGTPVVAKLQYCFNDTPVVAKLQYSFNGFNKYHKMNMTSDIFQVTPPPPPPPSLVRSSLVYTLSPNCSECNLGVLIITHVVYYSYSFI